MSVSNRGVISRLVEQLQSGALPRREFVLRAFQLGAAWGTVSMLLQACGSQKDRGDGADNPRVADDLGEVGNQLHIYNWSDYLARDTIPNFEREFGVRVTYDTYESNEEMVAKLQAGASGYDIVVPSGYIIPVLAALDLIVPLTRRYLTNFNNIAPLFRNVASDPGNRLTVPWQWGTSGIAYRMDKVNGVVDSWSVFHDRQYTGKMTMMDDGREVIGSWLRFRGHSLNSTARAELSQARADAIAAKGQLKAYISAPVKAQLISGDVSIAQLWDGDTAQARAEQPALAYVIPKEGCTIWADSMCIPKEAPHKRAAHEWMNYILRPEVGAALSEATGYGTPNEAAHRVMKRPVPYPSEAELERLEYQVDLGKETATWDQIWTEIKSA